MKINDYKFNIGDEVITIDGHCGEIIDICECERCRQRGFCEPMWEDETGDEAYIAIHDAEVGFNNFYKIGKYRFSDFRKDLVEYDIETHELAIAGLKKQLETIEEIESKSPYVRYFGETAIGWCKEPEMNKLFLIRQQEYANMKLKSRGYLFLNEVFDMLGFPRTQVGQIAGWVYDLENQIGDGFVDFGLFDTDNHEDVVRESNVFKLRFNAVGNILDRLEKE